MYEPKGGDKPAYNPPAEPQPYGKPPAEPPTYQKPPVQEPPYQKPPVEEPKYPPGEEPPEEPPVKPPCDPPTGPCTCKEWTIDNAPADSEPFRRLLLRLEAILEELSEKPTEATKKFADDLKDADKEYQGIVTAVTKYKDFFDKLDCKLAEVRTWKEEIDNWLLGKLTDAEKNKIKEARAKNYEAKDKEICCAWIKCRDYFISMQDCLEQAKKKEEEAKDDFDAIKGLEKTLSDRFTELKSLYDKAKGLRDEERFKAVYAVSLEFDEVVRYLGVIRDWWYARLQCGGANRNPCDAGSEPTGDLKKDWTPEKFKAQLVCRLRLLLLAKYQRFRWQHDFLSRTSDNLKKKDACDKFRKDRRDQFIQESEDISAPESGGGGGAGGGQPTEPTGQYQGGQQPGGYQPQPPGGGYQPQPPPSGYEPQPPSGGYQPPPPTGYEPKPPGSYEPKPPAGGYEPQPPSGGYQPQPPSGGYEPKPPSGGYEPQPPSGGYQPQPPSGGYEPKPPSGGYQPEPPPSGGYEPKPPKGGYKDQSKRK